MDEGRHLLRAQYRRAAAKKSHHPCRARCPHRAAQHRQDDIAIPRQTRTALTRRCRGWRPRQPAQNTPKRLPTPGETAPHLSPRRRGWRPRQPAQNTPKRLPFPGKPAPHSPAVVGAGVLDSPRRTHRKDCHSPANSHRSQTLSFMKKPEPLKQLWFLYSAAP